MKITTFNNRPLRHVRYMPDGSVILKLYERRPSGHPRHLRVSLAQWLAGRGVYLLESHASRQAQARRLSRYQSRSSSAESRRDVSAQHAIGTDSLTGPPYAG